MAGAAIFAMASTKTVIAEAGWVGHGCLRACDRDHALAAAVRGIELAVHTAMAFITGTSLRPSAGC